MVGVESILSKCWNCCRALCLSVSVTVFSLIKVTLGNRYTINVRIMHVWDTSFLSMLIAVRLVRGSSFEIWMNE